MKKISRRNAVFRCAMADLLHEWPLTLCVILSIAAILLPLAVLYGLKFGVISVLEERLRNDPRSRELRPQASSFFKNEWVQKWRGDPRVAFATGLPASLSATVQIPVGKMLIDSDITPTANGDPILAAAKVQLSGRTECAISEPLALQAKLKKGDEFEMRVKRNDASGVNQASAKLRVGGILPVTLCDFPAIYAPLPVAEGVEDFLSGFAVEEFAWPGSAPLASPVFDGALVALLEKPQSAPRAIPVGEPKTPPRPEPPSQPVVPPVDASAVSTNAPAVDQPVVPAAAPNDGQPEPKARKPAEAQESALVSLRLAVMERLGTTGFTSIKEDDTGLREQLGVAVEWPGELLYLSNANSLVDESNISTLRSRLEPLGLIVVPWTLPARCSFVPQTLARAKATNVEILAWSQEASALGLAPLGKFPSTYPWLVLGPNDGPAAGKLEWAALAGALVMDVKVVPSQMTAGLLWVDAANAGLIKRSSVRALAKQGDRLVYSRQGYAAFRIAVSNLDFVSSVKAELESQGISVLAETRRIEEIKFLDRQLGKIFTIFAAVSGVGAVTCLIAIAYSAAERKKRALAFLQIMGATRKQAARFPLYQCIVLTLCGALVAWVGNEVFASMVNASFSARLDRGENLSQLPADAVFVAVAALLAIAFLSFLLMIPRFIGMSLSEAAREP